MTDPNFHIKTPRLYISYLFPSNDAHCNFLVHLCNTPKSIASIGGKPTAITTTTVASQRLEGRFRTEHSRNGYGTYLVSLKPDPTFNSSDNNTSLFATQLASCKPIGNVSLMRGDSPHSYKAPDIGYAIVPEETGTGFAIEAARGLILYAKWELGVVVVFRFFEKGNAHSRRVVQKLGFEDCGVRALKEFGGAESEVWAALGMDQDLKVYGID